MSNPQGPSIFWTELKGKKVVGSDGKEIGEIKDVSQHYLRVEKGLVGKDKFWLPKFTVDAFDGKHLWLLVGGEEALNRYAYGVEPQSEEFRRDFETFRASPYGEKAIFAPGMDETIRMIEERNFDEYRNIREPER
ncbi:MAG: PRC-barrel domain-containing protein [Nitrososphaera sp.]